MSIKHARIWNRQRVVINRKKSEQNDSENKTGEERMWALTWEDSQERKYLSCCHSLCALPILFTFRLPLFPSIVDCPSICWSTCLWLNVLSILRIAFFRGIKRFVQFNWLWRWRPTRPGPRHIRAYNALLRLLFLKYKNKFTLQCMTQ